MKITKSKINKAEEMLEQEWDHLKITEDLYGEESEIYKRTLARWSGMQQMFDLLTN